MSNFDWQVNGFVFDGVSVAFECTQPDTNTAIVGFMSKHGRANSLLQSAV